MEGETANTISTAGHPRWGFRTPSPPPRGCIEPITPIHTPSIPYGELVGSESPKRRRLNKTPGDPSLLQQAPVPHNPAGNFHSYSEMHMLTTYSHSAAPQPRTDYSSLDLLADLALSRAITTPPTKPATLSKSSTPLEGPAPIHSYPNSERRSFNLSNTIIPTQASDGAAFSPLSLAKDRLISAHVGYGSTRVSQHPAYPSTILTMPTMSSNITFVPTAQPPPKNPSKSRPRTKAEGKPTDRRRSNRQGPALEEGSDSPKKSEGAEHPAVVERTKSDLVVDVCRESGPAEDTLPFAQQESAPHSDLHESPPEQNGEMTISTESAEFKVDEIPLPGFESPATSSATIDALPLQASPLITQTQLLQTQQIQLPITSEPTRAKSPQVLSVIQHPLNTIPTPPSTDLPIHQNTTVETILNEVSAPGQVSPVLSDSTVVLGEEPISPPRDVVMKDVEPIAEAEPPADVNIPVVVPTVGESAPSPNSGLVTNPEAGPELDFTTEVKPDAGVTFEAVVEVEAPAEDVSEVPIPNGHYAEAMDIDEPNPQHTESETCAICKNSVVPPFTVQNSVRVNLGDTPSSTAWIQCDACKKWHHNTCAQLDDSQVELIDKFHCPSCEPVKGQSTLRRKSTRVRASIDYGALNEGSSIPMKSDNNYHHYTHYLEGDFEFAGDEKFPRVSPEKLAAATYRNPNGWHFPVVVTAASNPRPANCSLGEFAPKSTVRADDNTLADSLPKIAEDAMGMAIPSDLTVRKVADLIGHDYPINVIDVQSQNQEKNWQMGRWAEYYESPKKDAVRNVISLEVSETALGRIIRRPRVVRNMDLSDWAWPEDAQTPTSVKLYCLMSVEKAYTDFHIDFGGSSVFYHVISGQKTFLFLEPTDENLKAYEEWCNHPDQNYQWLAEGRTCYRIDLFAGDTMLIPSGWIHAVYTPSDSLVIGGNFLTRQNVRMQMRVHEIETRTKVPRKFRYPNFAKLHWYVAQKYLQEDPVPTDAAVNIILGYPAHRRKDGEPLPGRMRMFLPEVKGLVNLSNFLTRNSLIANGDIDVSKETRTAVSKAIPKNLGQHGYECAKDFAIWACWKRSAGEQIAEWAKPGSRRGVGFPGVVAEKEPAQTAAEIREQITADYEATATRFQAYAQLHKAEHSKATETPRPDTTAPKTPAQASIQLLAATPSSAKSRAKRKRESKIDEDVFKEAISQVSMAGTFTRPKLTILGPLKTACDNCSKKKVRCVHKEEVQAKQREVQEVYNRLLREKHVAAGLAPEEYELPTPIAKRRASGTKSVRPEIHSNVVGPVEENVVMEVDTESAEPTRVQPDPELAGLQEDMVDAPGPKQEPQTTSIAVEELSLPVKEQDEKGVPQGIVAKNGRKKACNACRAVRRRCLHAPDGSGLVVDEASLQRAGVNTQPVVRKSRQEAASAIKASSAPPPSTRSTERSPEATPSGDVAETEDQPPAYTAPVEAERTEDTETVVESASEARVNEPALEASEVKEEAKEAKLDSIPSKQELEVGLSNEAPFDSNGVEDNMDDDNDSVCSILTSVHSSDLSEAELDDDKPKAGLLVTLHFPSKKSSTQLSSPPAPAKSQPPISNPSPARLSPPRRPSRHKISPPIPQRLSIVAPSPAKRKHTASHSPTTATATASSPSAPGKRPRRSSSSKVDDSLYHPHHSLPTPTASASRPLEGTDFFEESKIAEFGLRRRRSAGR